MEDKERDALIEELRIALYNEVSMVRVVAKARAIIDQIPARHHTHNEGEFTKTMVEFFTE